MAGDCCTSQWPPYLDMRRVDRLHQHIASSQVPVQHPLLGQLRHTRTDLFAHAELDMHTQHILQVQENPVQAAQSHQLKHHILIALAVL
jgi:hypothetical protein